MNRNTFRIFMIFILALTLISCDKTGDTTTQVVVDTTTQEVVNTTTEDVVNTTTERELIGHEEQLFVFYELIIENSSYSDSFDDWLSQVSPPTDNSRELLFTIDNNHLKWKYEGDSSWNTLVNLETLIGNVANNISYYRNTSNNHIIMEYNGDSYADLGDIRVIVKVEFVGLDESVFETLYVEVGETFTRPTAPDEIGYEFVRWSQSISTVSSNTRIFAVYELIDYTMTFVSNGGTAVNPITTNYGVSIPELDTPSKEGYTFVGWFEDTALTIEFNLGGMVDRDITLYAKWEINDYKITYYLFSAFDSEIDYEYLELIEEYIPEVSGYQFDGWYTDVALNNPFTMTNMPANNLDIYAKFTPIVYDITYTYPEGTEPVTNPTTYQVDTEDIVLNSPLMAGYALKWYDNPSFTGDEISTIVQGSIGDIDLYSRWELVEYILTYNLGVNGENNPANPTTYSIESSTITLVEPTRPGYTFDYWTSGSIITDIPAGSTGDMTITAVWTPITYTITYNSNDGANSIHNPDTYNPNTFAFTFLDAVKVNYSFGGWYETADFSGEPRTGVERYDYGHIVLYAKWIPDTYNITYNSLMDGTNNPLNPDTYNYDSNFSFVAAQRPGYTFEGWYDNSAYTGNEVTGIIPGTIGDITLYAKWSLATYTITYESNGGQPAVAAPTTYTINDVNIFVGAGTRFGYEFLGWYDNPEFTGDSINRIPDGSYGDITLYADWNLETYDLTYQLDGGVCTNNPATYTVLETPFTFNTPTKVGYTFDGWFESYDFSGSPVTGLTISDSGDKTLYAKWTAIIYTITYNYDGGNVMSNPSSYTIEDDTIYVIDSYKLGYDFLGWYEASDFSGERVTQIPTDSGRDIVLYANWDLKTLEITYYLNGGVNGSNPETYTVEDTAFTLEVPTRDGYTFGGWWQGYDFSGNEYTVINPAEEGFNITMYAKWTATDYIITYDLDGGFNETNPLSYNIESDTIVLDVATKDGYNFMGWYIEPDFSGTVVTEIPTGSTGNLELYADFDLKTYTITYVTVTDDYDPNTEILLYPNEAFIQIASGADFTIALTNQGRVFSWGENAYGQLGDNTTVDKLVAVEITDNFNLNEGELVTYISVGYTNSMAVTSDGRVFGWGEGNEILPYISVDTLVPTDISSSFWLATSEVIEKIMIEESYALAKSSTGDVYFWGYSTYKLGSGTSQTAPNGGFNSVLDLTTGETVIDIATQDNGFAVLTSNHRLLVWGLNSFGKLGTISMSNQYNDVDVTANLGLVGETIEGISMGASHMLVYTSNNSVYTWGFNVDGQLGDNTNSTRLTPTDISSGFTFVSGETIIQIQAFGNSSALLTSTGNIYVWGDNSSGQLGDATNVDKLVPTEISAQFGFTQGEIIRFISLSQSNTSAINDEGLAYVWGDNTSGQIGNNTTVASNTPVELPTHIMVIDSTSQEYFGATIDYYPEQTGYLLIGWYVDPELTTTFSCVMPAEDITVYAKWLSN